MKASTVLRAVNESIKAFDDHELTFVEQFVEEFLGPYARWDGLDINETDQRAFDVKIKGLRAKSEVSGLVDLVGSSKILEKLEDKIFEKYGYRLSLVDTDRV
jgi:hypothetical protein